MSTDNVKKRPRKTKKSQTERGAGSDDRIAELENRWGKLVTWGAKEKLKANQATIAELEAFFKAWREGRKDETYVTSATADVRRLEKEAAAFDEAAKAQAPFVDPGVPKTQFDIEKASASLEAAATVGKVADEGKALLKDATKDAFGALGGAASVIPWWAWVGGGLLASYLVLDRISKATVALEALSTTHKSHNARAIDGHALKGLLQ